MVSCETATRASFVAQKHTFICINLFENAMVEMENKYKKESTVFSFVSDVDIRYQ